MAVLVDVPPTELEEIFQVITLRAQALGHVLDLQSGDYPRCRLCKILVALSSNGILINMEPFHAQSKTAWEAGPCPRYTRTRMKKLLTLE